jgi:hypothetical protein
VISGLIELPGNRDFSPKDLVKLWQDESLGALSSRSQRISSRKFPFDVTSEDLWQSKDDACLSSRSQPFARSDNTLHNLITSTKSKDLLEQEDSGGVLELKRMATPRWLETLGEQFDRLDSKREGFIDSGDMMDLLQSMGQRCTIHEANEIVKHFDIDGGMFAHPKKEEERERVECVCLFVVCCENPINQPMFYFLLTILS